MSLIIPGVGETDYATSFSTTLNLLDVHDHSTGKGVALGTNSVPTAAIQAGAVTGAKLSSSVVDNSTIEINSNALRLKDGGITTAKIADSSVTQAKRAALGQQVSSSSGANVDLSPVTYTDMTNLSVTISTTGRPVFLKLISDGSLSVFNTGGANISIAFVRDGTIIGEYFFGSASDIKLPPCMLSHIDTDASSGSHVYKIQVKKNSGTPIGADNIKLVAFEL
jgi:hypothetical protein